MRKCLFGLLVLQLLVVVPSAMAAHTAPVLDAISPSSGFDSGGTFVTITGSDLDRLDSVTLGGNALEDYVSTETTITGWTPSGVAGDVVDLTVVDRWGNYTTLFSAFTYTAGPPPNQMGYFQMVGKRRIPLVAKSYYNSRGILSDLNGNDIPDLVFADTVLFNDGRGVFYEMGTLPTSLGTDSSVDMTLPIVFTDVDGDTDLDMFLANQQTSPYSVMLLLNDGTGAFTSAPPAQFTSPESTRRISDINLADFNNDGLGDILVAFGNGLAIYTNDALNPGTFIDETDVYLPTPPAVNDLKASAVNDFDGDGFEDLLFFNSATPYLFMGGGAGIAMVDETALWFAGPVPRYVYSIELADLDMDGDMDLFSAGMIVQNNFDNASGLDTSLSTLLQYNYSAALADIDGDGDLDIFSRASSGAYEATIYENQANVTPGVINFLPASMDYFGGNEARIDPSITAFGDVNGDSLVDFIEFANDSVSNDAVIVQRPDGTFVQESFFGAPSEIEAEYSIQLADFTGDSEPDILTRIDSATGAAKLSLLRGNGDGTFTQVPEAFPVGLPAYKVGVVDFDNINGLDLVAYDTASLSVLVFFNDGTGRFTQTAFTHDSPYMTGGNWLQAGDLTGDGLVDVFASVTGLSQQVLLVNNGDGTFSDETQFRGIPIQDTTTYDVEIADLNGDGKLDILCANAGLYGSLENLYIAYEDPVDGQIKFTDYSGSDGIRNSVGDMDFVLADFFYGDGLPDLLTVRRPMVYSTDPDEIYRNRGDGKFSVVYQATPNVSHNAGVACDLDGDGDLDALAGGGDGISYYRNENELSFTEVSAEWWQNPLSSTSALGCADFDGDGDVEVVESTKGKLVMYENTVYPSERIIVSRVRYDEVDLLLKVDATSSALDTSTIEVYNADTREYIGNLSCDAAGICDTRFNGVPNPVVTVILESSTGVSVTATKKRGQQQ